MNVVVKKKVGIIFTQIPLYIIYKFNEIAQQMKSNSTNAVTQPSQIKNCHNLTKKYDFKSTKASCY